MKKLLVFALMIVLLLPCLTGCLFAGLLLDDESSSAVVSKAASEAEGEPSFEAPIDAQNVMSIDIFDWHGMSDDQKKQWASDVTAIWQSYDSTLAISADAVLSGVAALLEQGAVEQNMFELACVSQTIDSSVYHPQTESVSSEQPVASNSQGGNQTAGGAYNIKVDASSLKYDIFDWYAMSDAEHIQLMDAYLVIWQLGGGHAVKVDKTAETLVAEVKAALEKDNEQVNIFEVACATQGIEPSYFYAG